MKNHLTQNSEHRIISDAELRTIADLGLPLVLACTYFGASEYRIKTHLMKLRSDPEWEGNFKHFRASVPHMIKTLSTIIIKNSEEANTLIGGLDCHRLIEALKETLGVSEICRRLDDYSRFTAPLLEMTFAYEIPESYRRFLIDLAGGHPVPKSGDFLWLDYLTHVSQYPAALKPLGTRNWPEPLLDHVVSFLNRNLKEMVMPAYGKDIVSLVEAHIFPPLDERAAKILRYNYGLGLPAKDSQEIAREFRLSRTRIHEIFNSTMRLIRSNGSTSYILPFPLTFEKVSGIMEELRGRSLKLPRKDESDPEIRVHPVNEIKMSARLRNLCRVYDIVFVEDFCAWREEEIRRQWRNCGLATVNEIKYLLKGLGLSLKPDV